MHRTHRYPSRSMPAVAALLLALLCCALLPNAAQAHAVDQSYVYLTIEDGEVTGRVEITTRDLNLALNLGLPETNQLTVADVERSRPALTNYLRDNLSFVIDDTPMQMVFGKTATQFTSFGKFVQFDFQLVPQQASVAARSAPEKISIGNSLIVDVASQHQSLVLLENHWESGRLDNESLSSLSYDGSNREQVLDLTNGSVLQGAWAFIKSGTHHIWIGLDHILFLIALLIPSVMVVSGNRWQGAEDLTSVVINVLKIVTAFTIAHSITLSVAALGVFTLPSRLVESIIALSIGIAALNLIWPALKTHSVVVVLAFGLFHGFGFASVLGELRIPDQYLVWSLLGFNIGVELGQLAIVALVLPVLYLLRNTAFYRRLAMPAAAAFLLAASIYWLYERIFDVNIPVKAPIKALFGL